MNSLKCFFWKILLLSIVLKCCWADSFTQTGAPCISQCRATSPGSKPICYYQYKSYDNCKTTGEIYQYLTLKGQKCNGKCGKFGKSYNWCFTEDMKSRDYCSTEPHIHSILKVLRNTQPITKNDYCSVKKSLTGSKSYTSHRAKRQNQPNSRTEVETGVDLIIENEGLFVTTSFDNPDIPVRSISTVLVAPDQNHTNPVTLTVAMRARIHYSHMRTPRQRIEQEVYNHLNNLDRENDDEAGHLLADSLGGFGSTENFAPQSRMLNRAVRPTNSIVEPSSWFDVEELIRRYLLSNPSGYVFWNLIVMYGFLPSSRRPTGFRLAVSFHDQNESLHIFEGGAVREFFFPNVPTSACRDANNHWWSHWRSQ